MINKFIIYNIIQFALMLSILFGIFSLSSCKTKMYEKYETISIDLKKSKTNNLTVNFNAVIKLETSDSSLIGEVTKVILNRDRIYILDRKISKSLFAFNLNGEFIKKTKIGRGPGECSAPWDFWVDSVSQKVILWDQSTFKILKYDMNLNHIYSKHYKAISLMNAEYINGDTLLVFGHITSKEKLGKTSYFSYSIYTDTLDKTISKILPTPKKLVSLSLDSPISKTDRIIFVAPFNNKVYGIIKNKEKVLYKLDFGKLSVTDEDIKKGINYVFTNAGQGNKITSIDNLHENNQFLTFTFFYRNRINFIIHSKTDSKNYYSKNFFDEKKLPRCVIKGIKSNGTFIAFSEADEMKKFDFSNTNLKKLDIKTGELDNPSILLFSLYEGNGKN
jgi:hypothetical protein